MGVPQAYKDYEINMSVLKLVSAASKMGITRWFPGFYESDAITYGTLTEDEKDRYKVFFYRRTMTKTMLSEVKEMKENAAQVDKSGVPDVPILIFSSNGQGSGWNESEWRSDHENYIEACNDGKLILLDCAHYVHDIEYARIAQEISVYLDG